MKHVPSLSLLVMAFAATTASAQSFSVEYLQSPAGVTGLISGAAPYDTPDARATTYADVGPGAFGAGGTLTTFSEVAQFSGVYDLDLGTLVAPDTFIDPSSVAGPLVYLQDFGGVDGGRFQMVDGLTAGDSFSSEIFFAGHTLATLGIAPTTSVSVTFSPDDANLTPFTFTFAAVPEPTSLVLLGVGGLALMRRRRRHA